MSKGDDNVVIINSSHLDIDLPEVKLRVDVPVHFLELITLDFGLDLILIEATGPAADANHDSRASVVLIKWQDKEVANTLRFLVGILDIGMLCEAILIVLLNRMHETPYH